MFDGVIPSASVTSLMTCEVNAEPSFDKIVVEQVGLLGHNVEYDSGDFIRHFGLLLGRAKRYLEKRS